MTQNGRDVKNEIKVNKLNSGEDKNTELLKNLSS